MNPAKQFWALLKFQLTINPAILVFPLVLGLPLFLPLITTSVVSGAYHPSFLSLFMNQNLFFVAMIGAMILAPEKFQFGGANLTSGYYGSEFLLTRAIDRFVLYRAKATLLFILVLLLPAFAVLHSVSDPNLIVDESSKGVQQQCLSAIPGSAIVANDPKHPWPKLISIPRGNVLVAQWQFCVLLVTSLAVQLLVLILYPFKYAKWVFWTVFFGMIFAPLFFILHQTKGGAPNLNERFFFFFAGHQALFWCAIGAAFVGIQLWCERRFAELEQ